MDPAEERHTASKTRRSPAKKRPSQLESNPFPYSEDNKRYFTISYYLKQKYGQKTAKIPLNARFTCPNRDGTKSVGGCSFCSAKGSGDTILGFDEDLPGQYAQNLERARLKWPSCKGIAYFQAYSNTYAPLSVLQAIYEPFYASEDVEEVCIATRADCLEEEAVAWFASQSKETWMEIGLQSIHEKTTTPLNRAHSTYQVAEAIALCKQYGLHTCVHIINGLPGETPKDMLETARMVAAWHPDAIKIHMLHLLQGTRLEAAWKLDPFPLLSQEEYVSIVCDQLEVLPPDMIIERLTGDGVAADLVAPLWTLKKTAVTNAIDTELFRRNSWQGKSYIPPVGKDA